MAREIYSPIGHRYLVTINIFFYLLLLLSRREFINDLSRREFSNAI
jgi:hypothetical protein